MTARHIVDSTPRQETAGLAFSKLVRRIVHHGLLGGRTCSSVIAEKPDCRCKEDRDGTKAAQHDPQPTPVPCHGRPVQR